MAKQAALRRETTKDQNEKEKLRGVHGGAPHSAHEIDRMIHERLRLGIISALAANESLTFNELKHTVKTTDGNLSVHARKLEDAGYIKMALSPPLGAAPPRATVNEITHLGRAAARYFAADAGFFGRAQAMHRSSTPVPRPVAGQARFRSVAC